MIVAFDTLGCKVNHYETQAMAGLFEDAGHTVVPFDADADVYIVNTCTVTATGDQKSRQQLQKAHRNHPDALIVAVGCYAQVAPDALAALPGVSLIIGADGKHSIVERVCSVLSERAATGKCEAPCAPAVFVPEWNEGTRFENLFAVRDGRTRATLKIQDGCRNFCTYCIIPYARGPLRSRPMDDIGVQLGLLAAEGFSEVVLTGIHLASYGLDLPAPKPELLDVLRLAGQIPGVRRVRLGSLEPKLVTEHFAASCAALPCLCRQFHLSLQSGSDTVLARMGRRYTGAEYRQAVALLREHMPDCAVTTDIIAGFPGETEAEHAETMRFVEALGFSRIHVFPYSKREGTAAARMPNHLPNAVKQARARELIALGRRLEDAFMRKMIGTICEVLIEHDGEGYSGNYVRVRVKGRDGEIVRCRIVSVSDGVAIGEET